MRSESYVRQEVSYVLIAVLRKRKDYVELEQSVNVSQFSLYHKWPADALVEQRAAFLTGFVPLYIPT
jgi:hypothetical protein